MVFNVTFKNILFILLQSVPLVEETGEKNRPVTNKGNNKITEHRAIL